MTATVIPSLPDDCTVELVGGLIDEISQQGKPAFALPNVDEIVTHIVPELRTGDVVAIMSNGGFGGIHEKILSGLRTK